MAEFVRTLAEPGGASCCTFARSPALFGDNSSSGASKLTPHWLSVPNSSSGRREGGPFRLWHGSSTAGGAPCDAGCTPCSSRASQAYTGSPLGVRRKQAKAVLPPRLWTRQGVLGDGSQWCPSQCRKSVASSTTWRRWLRTGQTSSGTGRSTDDTNRRSRCAVTTESEGQHPLTSHNYGCNIRLRISANG